MSGKSVKKANELYPSSKSAEQSREKFEEKTHHHHHKLAASEIGFWKILQETGSQSGASVVQSFKWRFLQLIAEVEEQEKVSTSGNSRKLAEVSSSLGKGLATIICCASVKEKQTEKEAIIVSAPRTAKRENNKRRRSLWLEIRWRKDDRKEIFILEILLLLTARHNNMAQNINPERAASSNPSKQSDETLINNNNHAVSKRWVALLWRLSALIK